MFISYRREDTGWAADSIDERLVRTFGRAEVFLDLRSIRPGEDFTVRIEAAVASCRVMIVMIGPRWLELADEHGRRRIDDPGDLVRREIEAALGREGVQVIPVLVDGARLPSASDLPASLRPLTRRQTFELSRAGFDLEPLVQLLRDLLKPPSRADGRGRYAAYAVCRGHRKVAKWDYGVWACTWHPTAPRMASGGDDRTTRIWNTQDGSLLATLSDQRSVIRAVAFSPDGRILACGGGRGRDPGIWLRDAANGEALNKLPGPPVRSLAYSPDGAILASAEEAQIVLRDPYSGVNLRTLAGHENDVTSLAFDPSGGMLASASWDRTVRLWDAASGAAMATLRGHEEGVVAVDFSGDGLLATAGNDQTVRLWDAQTRRQLRILARLDDSAYALAFRPDGRAVVTGNRAGKIQIWMVESGVCTMTLNGHQDWIQALAFQPGSDRLASGCRDKTVRLWGWVSTSEA